MTEITDRLPDYFVRCHQSYTVNINAIQSYNSCSIELDGEKQIPVSRSRRTNVQEAIKRYYHNNDRVFL